MEREPAHHTIDASRNARPAVMRSALDGLLITDLFLGVLNTGSTVQAQDVEATSSVEFSPKCAGERLG